MNKLMVDVYGRNIHYNVFRKESGNVFMDYAIFKLQRFVVEGLTHTGIKG